ncbi:hypothetical protein [Paraburkholderia sp. SIMBA_030]|uniref:hypothetical protein n=1 Tax=Paraburkholderia sp. SIMBA_030 TaxID=3085773 RepID=UPI0039791434
MSKLKGPCRQPRGVLSPEPVLFRLMPEERQALETLAASTNCSLSRTAGEVFREGLGPYSKKVMQGAAQAHAKPIAES